MKLGDARLCLDCDEVHESQQCPVCASESFAFVTRWVPCDMPRTRARAQPAEAPVRTRGSRLLKGGAVGLAAIAITGWLLGRPGDTPPQDRQD
jgi:hypothetical protein